MRSLDIPKDSMGPFVGEAGELRVASEILLRGINVSAPSIDNGIDLIIVDTGKRIQVKTSRSEYSRTRGYSYPAYLFNVRKKKYVNSKNITLRPKIDPNKIDFVICWAVDHDWFFIIPIKDVNQTTINIPIDPQKPSKYKQYLEAWDLLKK